MSFKERHLCFTEMAMAFFLCQAHGMCLQSVLSSLAISKTHMGNTTFTLQKNALSLIQVPQKPSLHSLHKLQSLETAVWEWVWCPPQLHGQQTQVLIKAVQSVRMLETESGSCLLPSNFIRGAVMLFFSNRCSFQILGAKICRVSPKQRTVWEFYWALVIPREIMSVWLST